MMKKRHNKRVKPQTLKTRQEKRVEKRRARKQRDIFETGLEAVEIPTAAQQLVFTTTESLVYQVLLLHSDRKTGHFARAKVAQYAEWTGTKSLTTMYTAFAGLKEKGVIEVEINGWVTGKVLLRYQNKPKDKNQQELLIGKLGRSLVHRQALNLMIAHRVAPITQRVYWKLASEIDLATGKIHFQRIGELADFFGCEKAAIYKAFRQINDAGLGSLIVDYGVDGHLEHVALSYHIIQLAVERKKEMQTSGINKRHASRNFDKYRTALYQLFGIPIEALTPNEIQAGIDVFKDKLQPYVDSVLNTGDGFEVTDWGKELGIDFG